jgi:hypothetical protein
MSSSTNIINPKPCSYNCWNTSSNSYLEVFTKQKHICKNRTKSASSPSYSNKPNYYNKFTKQPKPKMSNSLELISGHIETVQKKYEILSDIISDQGGKTHGSQSHPTGNNISLIAYYEVPEGKREEIKSRVKNSILFYLQSKTKGIINEIFSFIFISLIIKHH